MKKSLIFLCLFVLSVSVFAQSLDDACYAECKRGCLAQKAGDDCYKVCSDKCKIQPSPVLASLPISRLNVPVQDLLPDVNCDNWQDLYKRCLSGADARACADKFADWKKRCSQEPASLSCEDECKRAASQQGLTAAYASFNQQVFEECLRDRCKKPVLSCEDKCKDEYGTDVEKLSDCLVSRCGQKPVLSCEGKCKVEYSDYPDKLDDCLRSRCGFKPLSCDDVCRRDFGSDGAKLKECLTVRCLQKPLDCKGECYAKFGNDLKSAESCVQERCLPKRECEKKCRPIFDLCINECEKPGCLKNCEDSCSSSYVDCMRSPQDRLSCRESLGGCLDLCAGTVEDPCKKRCRDQKDRCLVSGRSQDECRSMLIFCNGVCASNAGESDQSLPVDEAPDCKERCDDAHALCSSRPVVASASVDCDSRRVECYRVCDGGVLTAQPGLVSRVWSSIFG